jgi:hypothetical protein
MSQDSSPNTTSPPTPTSETENSLVGIGSQFGNTANGTYPTDIDTGIPVENEDQNYVSVPVGWRDGT